jgi:hypothetical protein
MWKSKTVYVGLAAVITAIGSFMAAEISVAEMLQISVTAVLAIFLRHGIKKSEVAADAAAEAASTVLPVKKKKATG